MCPTNLVNPSIETTQNPNQELQSIKRNTADFPPSIWGDVFLDATVYESSDMSEVMKEIDKLKEEVKNMLTDPIQNDYFKNLELIDTIQRLGLSYHFEKEIGAILEQIYNSTKDKGLKMKGDDQSDDLHCVSLWFRLLRQQGYSVSSGVFNNFELKKKLGFKLDSEDARHVKGVLSFYEAMEVRKHEDDELDDLHAYVAAYLDSIVSSLKPFLKVQVSHALNRSLRKGMPRIEARHFITIYEQQSHNNEILLMFAKLDFNHLQKLHLQELSDVARWWEDLDVKNKVGFARDRVVEAYFWSLGVYFEPQYSLARKFTAKVITMSSIIDDFYDAFGTEEEHQLFTEAIQRWESDAANTLPGYLQHIYKALLAVYTEMEEAMGSDQRKIYRLHYAKATMNELARAYFEEVQWLHRKYVPTMEEYIPLALATTGYAMIATSTLVGMGDDVVTEDVFEWISSFPTMLKASCLIVRLMDDIVSHQFEQKRGHVASAVECYTKQHGVSEEEAVKVFRQEISNAWKDVNEAYMRPAPAPAPVLDRVLNLVRMMDVIYKDFDGYTTAVEIVLKDHITEVLLKPLQLNTNL